MMQLPQWLARFNRHVTNPVQRLWAGFVPTMGILEHVGRRSGAHYRTPLTVFTTDDGIAILLTYGPIATGSRTSPRPAAGGSPATDGPSPSAIRG